MLHDLLPGAALLLLLAHVLPRVTLIWRAKRRPAARGAAVLLAARFHAPLYALSGTLLLLRMLLLMATALPTESDAYWGRFALLWLAEAPGAALAALYAHLALFFASVAHSQSWPTSSSGCRWLAVAYVGFCALLLLLATLFAGLRSALTQLRASHRRRRHGDLEIQQLASARATYAALVWTVLALLLLKYQAKCTQFLWRERRHHRLRALSASALHAMAVCSTLLALLLLARAMLTLFVFSISFALIYTGASSLWSQVLVEDVGWELATISVLFYMLRKVPIAYEPRRSVFMAATAHDQVESVSYHFHVPKLSEIVEDFVVTTSHSLQQRARLERYDGLFFDDESGSHQESCKCCGRRAGECECDDSTSDKRLLSRALLADEYPVGSDLAGRVDGDDGDGENAFIPLYYG